MNGAFRFSYENLAIARIDELKLMMDAVIGAEQGFMVPVLKSLFLIFAGRQFLLTQYGFISIERFVGSIIRVGIITLLITHSGEFVHYVRDPIFDRIPQAISGSILSAAGIQTTATTTVAQLFDKVSMAADATTAKILALNVGWSSAAWSNYMSAALANGLLQMMLTAICGIWLLGQTLLAIILCFGLFLLGFELFERTRGWVDQWIGKLVGMTCFGVGTAILLALQMTGLLQLLKATHDSLPASGSEAVGAYFHVCGNVLLDLLTMVSLPLICSIGSGVAASLAAPSALVTLRALPLIGSAGQAVGGAAASAARGGARALGGARPNVLTRR